MSIVCVADSASASSVAVPLAVSLAERLRMPLHLAGARAAPLREARLHPLSEPAALALAEIACRVDAHAVVLPAPREGSLAECNEVMQELLRTARVPVLFARESAAFEGWARETRPLAALVDVDFTPAAERTVHWIERLAMAGPCELIALHEYESARAKNVCAHAGLQTYVSDGHVRASLERELRAYVGPLQGDLTLRVRIEPARQPHAIAVANVAVEEGADLIAFGVDVQDPRARGLATQMMHEALTRAACCVLCVPAADPRALS